MTCRAVAVLPFVCGLLAAQYGTQPKRNEQDYPAHAKFDQMSIGAEYLVHSFSGGGEMYIAKDFLVVEVALFPVKGETLTVSAGQFALLVNGRKPALEPRGPEFVASSLKYPDPDTGRRTEASVGPVIFGAPAPTSRFPGDPTVTPPRPAPRAPDANPTGLEKQPPVKAEDLVVQAALPEGEHHGPVSGYLYFAYRGKPSRIHSLELSFTGPNGTVTLPLPLL